MSELAISYAALILADDGVDITVSLIIQNYYLERKGTVRMFINA